MLTARAPAARAAAVSPNAIVSPFVDALCTGGLSVLVLVPLLVMGRTDVLLLSVGVQAWLGALINMPHFLASYRMVLVSFHVFVYLVILLAGSIVATIVLPLGAMAVVTNWLGSRPGEVVAFAISAFFNIHRYFTDGVVWKLRKPEVREDLFGHLQLQRRR